jgi:hypothetical protein
MHTHLNNGYDTPEPVDNATRLNQSPSLDAIETLKAVQGLINTFLANAATADDRAAVPAPAQSPAPKSVGNRKLEVVDMNGGQGPAVRQDAGLLGGSEVTNGTLKEINKDGGAGDSAKTPPVQEGLDQDRLQHLADGIARNISQTATNDAARIKTATAALELAAAVRPPGDTIMGWFANMSVISAVRLFLHWGAFDIIPSGKGESITYTELASRIKADEALLSQ